MPEGRRGPTWFAAALLLAAGSARAQVYVPEEGTGTWSATYQFVVDHDHLNYKGDRIQAGVITTQSLMLRFDYGFSDRWAVTMGLPFVNKRYVGSQPHSADPFHDGHDDHHHVDVVDDGHYHGTWQDAVVGLRYRWRDETWLLTPFANLYWPTHDYVFFSHAAPGTGQKRLQIGLGVGRQFEPPADRWYASGSYSYTFVEEVLDISVNYSTLYLEVGYHFSPRWSARALANMRMTHGGLDFPIDFPLRNDDRWLHHDQIQRVDYANAGLGIAYRPDDRYTFTLDWMTTVWGENGHAIHNAFTFGIYRGF